MEEFKSLADMLSPDERWAHFAIRDEINNSVKAYTVEDRYAAVEAIKLSNSVPDELNSQFNVARMLCLYSWLYYPINQVAELKSFSVVEAGLRIRFPEVKPNLSRLLRHAVNQDVLVDSGFSAINIDSRNPKKYSSTLPEAMASLRNDLAHGSQTLHPGSIFTLTICSEILNQLFPGIDND